MPTSPLRPVSGPLANPTPAECADRAAFVVGVYARHGLTVDCACSTHQPFGDAWRTAEEIAAMIDEDRARVLDCGHAPTDPTRVYMTGVRFTGGYARCTNPDGTERTLCYACADREQRETLDALPEGERFSAYLDGDGQRLTTWTGGELARVIRAHRTARKPWGGRREGPVYFVTARTPSGRILKGYGQRGMGCNVRAAN